jgi:ATP-dependent DNA helicase RecG
LAGPLRLERRQGFADKAVQGGLEAYVRRWAPELGPHFEGYAGMAAADRERAVALAEAVLGTAPAEPVRAEPKPAAAPVPRLKAGDPVSALSALGPKRTAALRALGIQSVGDLLLYTPRDWQDRSRMLPIAQLQEGQLCSIQGRVLSSVNFRTRSRLTITEVAIQDDSGSCSAVYFNQPFQQRRFKQGDLVVLSGKAERKARTRGMQLMNPEAEVVPEGTDEALIHTGRIVPLYSTGKELSQRVLRSALWQALEALPTLEELLPQALRAKRRLPELAACLRTLHFPDSLSQLEPARLRLAYDELLTLALALEQRKRKEQEEAAPVLRGGALVEALRAKLPFALTGAQARVWGELQSDLARPKPMRRLVQGDVGSGKTVLAALALAAAVGEGWQGALMAPTEILAEQHLRNLRRFLEPLGVDVLSLTQAQKGKGRKEVLAHLASGRPLIAVGTQALIQEGVDFGHLGLVVVDEQHRFGVRQRLTLSKKAKLQPHTLVMTATPIPRTLAMTAYGDLDVSVVDELPPGRSPIVTRWLKPAQAGEVWATVAEQIQAGRQAYVVVPLVDESDKAQWADATTKLEELRTEIFPGLRIEMLHGRMKPEEKEAVMAAFTSREVPILCATTVVEVGVDVPNATVMVIEDADRFGLAQLHQLRGRVGRGAAQSYCFLLGEPGTEDGARRLRILAASQDGFVIAEEDLKLRGPGEVLGTRQSGLPELRQADLLKDQAVLIQARQDALEILDRDPALAAPGMQALAKAVGRLLAQKVELGSVG